MIVSLVRLPFLLRPFLDPTALARNVLNGAERLNDWNKSLPMKGQSGMQAVTVISTTRSGEFNITSTVVLAGLLVGKNLAYSSL